MACKLIFPFDESLYLPMGIGGLRYLCETDEPALIQIALRQPDLFQYTLHSMKTQEEIKAYFQIAYAQWRQHLEYPFAILHPESGQIIGTTRFYQIMPAQASLAIGYTWLDKDYHGTGLNSLFKHLMLEFVFKTLNFQRVEFRTDSENLRSIRSLQKLGAISEGELRSHMFRPDGSRRNTHILSIIKQDYTNQL